MIKVIVFTQNSEKNERPCTEIACKDRNRKEWQQVN